MPKSQNRRALSKIAAESPLNPLKSSVEIGAEICSDFESLRFQIASGLDCQKRPDVHKIILSIPRPGKSVNLEDVLLICTVFPKFGPFFGGGGTKFSGEEFMDIQTFLRFEIARDLVI